MWRFRKPTPAEARQFAADQRDEPFSYDFAGAIAHYQDGSDLTVSKGFVIDCTRQQVGTGDSAFASACDVLRDWRHFPRPWTSVFPADAPLRQGTTVAVLAQVLGLWLVNSCRVLHVVDETGPRRRFGFTYGTLPQHAERGEERFLVEMNARGEVWYEIRAASRPRWWLARLTYPLARRYQRKFVADSMRTMREQINQQVASP